MKTICWAAVPALFCAGAATASPLTEQRVIELAGVHAPSVRVANATTDSMQARELAPSLYPNPQIGWNREALVEGDEESEDSLFATLPVVLSGRRAAARQLAESNTAVARASAKTARSRTVSQALQLYYRALWVDAQRQALARASKRLSEAARVIARRRSEGTTSGYEQDRIDVERQLTKSQELEVSAQARPLRTTLGLLLGEDLRDVALPADTLAPSPGDRHGPATPPSVSHLGEAVAHANQAKKHGRTAWLPNLSLSGGLRRRTSVETDLGYVVGVTVEVPLFARGQDIKRRAAAAARLTALMKQARRQKLATDAIAARGQYLALAKELARFERETKERTKRLERAAASRYREGSGSILELLDAQRALTGVELRVLQLQHAARRAELSWREALGEFE